MPKNKEIYKKTSEFNYTPPVGGWDTASNVDTILNNLCELYNVEALELSQREFFGFWRACNAEVMLAFLLGNREKNFNKFLENGFDFRGIKIRVEKIAK